MAARLLVFALLWITARVKCQLVDCNDPLTPCQNSGICDAVLGTCSGCPGYTGDLCDTDVNECDTNNGGCSQMCTNSIGSFACSCNSGYELDTDGITCNDVNECDTNNGGCSQMCTNDIGSFACSCNSGYELGTDDITCNDLNECSDGTDDCEQICNNHVGGYTCSCELGCELSSDSLTCEDINECAMGMYDCGQICTNTHCTEGRYNCSCNDGYRLGSDSHTCLDINECDDDTTCAQTCTNSVGSYSCGCYAGCSINSDGYSCDDENECALDTHNCDHICNNTFCTEGRYFCSCSEGYKLGSDDHNCFDKDECELGLCNQTCTNTDGSFHCGCESGCTLNSDGLTCDDIDECKTNTSACDQLCSKNLYCTLGRYECGCYSGYALAPDSQVSCEDNNECELGTHKCEHMCNNTIGSYSCNCLPGCELEGNGLNCTDINECDTETDECQQGCKNMDCERQRYECFCWDGFVLNDDMLTCSDINECDYTNGNCEHNCTNYNGTYNCSCKAGYRLDDDGMSCIALPCSYQLTSPLEGSISCSGDNVTGDKCWYSCDFGFYLDGPKSRNCLADGTWSGTDPECLKLTCPEQQPQSNSLLLLPCDNKFESVCTISCEDNSYIDVDEQFFIVTCVSESENNTYWTDSKTCMTNSDVCNPNPCHNNGVCLPPFETPGEVTCECGQYFSGKYCENTLLVTPQLPVLLEGQESETFFIYSNLKESVIITIVTDASIQVLPDKEIHFNRANSSISFKLKPLAEGFFKIGYFISPVTTDTFETPKTSYLVVQAASDTSNYFETNNITNSSLMPGCCVMETDFHLSYCTRTGQQITLSSSCSWEEPYKTNGITFIHSGGIDLPVSIVGTESVPTVQTLPVDHTYGNCESSSSDCLNWDVTPTDVVEMLKQQSLLRTFLASIERLVPSSVMIDTSIPIMEYMSAQPFWYYASLVNAEVLTDLSGCEQLRFESDGLLYAIRSTSQLDAYINGQSISFENQQLAEVLCFAIDVCRMPQSPLHMSIPVSLREMVRNLAPIKDHIPDNWIIDVQSASISSYGVYPSFGDKWFWNGSAMVDMEIPTYDVGMNLNASSGQHEFPNIPRFIFSFDGVAYSKFNETIPSLLKGIFGLQISPILENREDFLILNSYDEYGLLIVKEISSKFQTGASLSVLYNPNSNPGFFGQFFSTTNREVCLVHTFVSWNASYTPQYISLSGDCLSLMMSNAEIPDMTVSVTIPLVQNYWPSSTTTAVRVTGRNSNDNKIKLGNFSYIPIAQSESDQLYLEIYQDSSYSASLKQVNFVLFNKTVETTIEFTPEPTFTAIFELYDNYRVWIEGSAQVPNSWENAVLFVKGTFMESDASFQNRVQASLEEFLNYEADTYNTRVHEAELQMNSSIYQQKYYESELQILEDLLSKTSDEAKNAMKNYQQALIYITVNESQFQNFVDLLPFSESEIQALYSVCDLFNCSQNCCQFQTEAMNCEADVTYPILKTVDDVNPSTVIKQETKEEPELHCTLNTVCHHYKGIKWLSKAFNSSVTSPLVRSEITLPFAYTANRCKIACESGNTVKTSFENVSYAQNISLKYLQIEDIQLKRTHACFLNDTCEGEVLEEPCTTRNYDCNDIRKLNAISRASQEGVSAPIFKGLTDNYHEYSNAVNMAIASKALLEIKRFEEGIITQKISLLKTATNSSMSNHAIAVSAFNEIKDKVPFINELLDSYSTHQIFKVNSITFSLSLTTESPTNVPLIVNYSIPYLNENHLASFDFDFRTPFHLVLNRLTRFLVDDLFLKVGKNANNVTKYQYEEDVESQFKDTCVILEMSHSFLMYLQQSLLEAQNDFEYSEQMILSTLINEKERANSSVSSISDLSQKFQTALSTNQLQYVSVVESNYYDLQSTIEITSFTHWLNAFNEYISITNNVSNQQCFSFTDCLIVLADLLSSKLLIVDESSFSKISVKVSTVIENLQHLAWKRNLTLSEAIDLISPITILVEEIKQLNYWCSTKPVVSQHPLPEYFLPLNGTGILSCEGVSKLSVSYRWWKDGIILPNQISANLTITIFDNLDIGYYTCEAYNDVGSTYSLPSLVRLYVLPSITTNPQTQVTYSGNENGVQFKCEGSSPYSYHYNWVYRKTEGAESVEMNTTSNILRIDFPDFSDGGLYQCTITNMFGNTSSDLAKLAIVDASITTVRYPIQFVITDVNAIGNTESADGSDYFDITNDTTFIDMLKLYLRDWTQQGYNVSFENISVSKYIEDYSYIIYFELSSMNTSSDSISSDGLSSILMKMRGLISDVEEGKEVLLRTLNNAELFYHSKTSFEIKNGSVFSFTKRYDCPLGQELDESFISCVSCAYGEYASGHTLLYRSDMRNSFYPVLVPRCSVCPIGYYQSSTGATECIECPENHTTLINGASSITDCHALCLPRTYSPDGVRNCQNCPENFYQMLYGSTKCLSCKDVPTDNDYCEIDMTTPPGGVEFDKTTLIIGTAVGCGVALAFFIFCAILIILIGCRKKKQKLRTKEELDKVIPYRRVSAFDGTSIRRGMPIQEPKSNELAIKNPIYKDEPEVLQMQYMDNFDKEHQQHEGTTEVTFVDDIDDKMANLVLENDDALLLPPEERKLAAEEKVANELVAEAISSALGNTTEKTPLVTAEEVPEELDDEQRLILTQELELELAQQLPQRMSDASIEENETEGLETIIEEPLEDQGSMSQDGLHARNEENDFSIVETDQPEKIQHTHTDEPAETSQPPEPTPIDEYSPPAKVDEQDSPAENYLGDTMIHSEVPQNSMPAQLENEKTEESLEKPEPATVGEPREYEKISTLQQNMETQRKYEKGEETVEETPKPLIDVQTNSNFDLPLESNLEDETIHSEFPQNSMPFQMANKETEELMEKLEHATVREPTESEKISTPEQNMETQRKYENGEETVEEPSKTMVDMQNNSNFDCTIQQKGLGQESTKGSAMMSLDAEQSEMDKIDEQRCPPIDLKQQSSRTISYEVETAHKQLPTEEHLTAKTRFRDAAEEPESDDNEHGSAIDDTQTRTHGKDQQEEQTVGTNPRSESTAENGEHSEPLISEKVDEEKYVAAQQEKNAQITDDNQQSSANSTGSGTVDSPMPTKMVTFAEERQQDVINDQDEKLIELNKIIEEISMTEVDDQHTEEVRNLENNAENEKEHSRDTPSEATVDKETITEI